MGTDYELDAEGILLSRIALLEHRLQALAGLVVETRGQAVGSGVSASTVLDADSQRELAAGFHHREHDAAGRSFRWAGKADHFEIRFHVDRSAPRPFRMTGRFVAGIAPDSLRGYVDYRPIPLRIEHEDGMVAVVGRLPADPLCGGTTLTFHCPAMVPRNSPDVRRLSFAFVRLVAGEARSLRAAA